MASLAERVAQRIEAAGRLLEGLHERAERLRELLLGSLLEMLGTVGLLVGSLVVSVVRVHHRQQQQARLDAQSAQLTALTARLAALEQQLATQLLNTTK